MAVRHPERARTTIVAPTGTGATGGGHELKYSLHRWSSFYSDAFHPNNILVDNPKDETSRWLSESNRPPQYLTLKLSHGPCIVRSITFGKYKRAHVCNLHLFDIFAGLDENEMKQVYTGELRNDDVKETFHLKPICCNFLKIVPHLAWEQTFGFSIWYVELRGQQQQQQQQQNQEVPMTSSLLPESLPSVSCHEKISPIYCLSSEMRSAEVTRHCLKHLRKLGYMDLFSELGRRSRVKLEHPQLTQLHYDLVECADFETSEQLIEEAANRGNFDEFLNKQEIDVEWKRIRNDPSPKSGSYRGAQRKRWPGMRGGHQMVFDPCTKSILLFGGWDGEKDLADLWQYHLESQEWECLSLDTEKEGGPCARSCHKMCLDWKRRKLYTFGRYYDSTPVETSNDSLGDLYLYDLATRKWTLLSADTSLEGGPGLVIDHQMCIDSENETIYVFGGKVYSTASLMLESSKKHQVHQSSGHCLSGRLYSYHISSRKWTQILNPSLWEMCQNTKGGLGMVFNEVSRQLFLIGSFPRYIRCLAYYVDTCQIRNFFYEGGMNGRYIQRVSIDCEKQEIYIFSGHRRTSQRVAFNSVCLFKIETEEWLRVCKFGGVAAIHSADEATTPCARFAYQLVFDPISKTHFIYGGNAGKQHEHRWMRLDDFWTFTLVMPSGEQLVRSCKLMIRRQRFEELSHTNSVEALSYLQNDLSALVDHGNQAETDEFCALVSVLITNFSQRKIQDDSHSALDEFRMQRNQLFDKLCGYFPESMTKPVGTPPFTTTKL
ncbi:muskelin-like [Oscarella lobularis]|uniref:muskelin-like n=1 Tax=Oscarella lobularis TaxID=121494 RepID=UPI0033143E85